MTPPDTHALIRMFFTSMPSGTAADLLTEDFTAWTTTSPTPAPRARYLGGIQMLQSLFPAGLHYTVDAVIAEADRAAAEVRSHGIFADGEAFSASYVFTFKLRDGRIAALAEHFDPRPVEEQIKPRMMAALRAQAAG